MNNIMLKDIVKPVSSSLKLSQVSDSGKYAVYGAGGICGYIDDYKVDNDYIAIVKDGAGVGRPFYLKPKESFLGTMQGLVPKDNNNAKYIYLLIQYLNIGKKQNGASIPHIYFKDYGKTNIKEHSYDQQVKIVSELETIIESIELKKNQILLCNELKLSTFQELFGNVLLNDKNFDTVPFSTFVSQMNIGPFGSDLKTDSFVEKNNSYCMVYEQKHAIGKSVDINNRYINRDKYEKLKRFDVGPGDIIVSCRGTIGECYLLPENAPNGIIHPSLLMIKLKDNVEKIFVLHLLERIFENQRTEGSGVKMAIKAKELSKIKVISPSRNLQTKYKNIIKNIDEQLCSLNNELASLEELLDKKMEEYFI